jgi:hypothetical protein
VKSERWPSFTTKSKTFVVGQIVNKISNIHFLLAYYVRYLKLKASVDTYDFLSMHLVFESSLEQLFKENLKQ